MASGQMNPVRIEGDTTYLGLRVKEQEEPLWVPIDTADMPLVRDMRWHRYRKPRGRRVFEYVVHYGPPYVLIHRHLLQPPPKIFVDHINHDGLDNRRSNLRLATNEQNQWNRRGEDRGVYRRGARWEARFSLTFDSYEEASAQRRTWEQSYHGEFAAQ